MLSEEGFIMKHRLFLYSAGLLLALSNIAGCGGRGDESTSGFAYVANFSDNTVSQYTIGTGGALNAMTPATAAAGVNPISVTVDPSARYAYVANGGGTTVSQYTIGATGALSAMTPATVVAGTNPSSVTTTGMVK